MAGTERVQQLPMIRLTHGALRLGCVSSAVRSARTRKRDPWNMSDPYGSLGAVQGQKKEVLGGDPFRRGEPDETLARPGRDPRPRGRLRSGSVVCRGRGSRVPDRRGRGRTFSWPWWWGAVAAICVFLVAALAPPPEEGVVASWHSATSVFLRHRGGDRGLAGLDRLVVDGLDRSVVSSRSLALVLALEKMNGEKGRCERGRILSM